MNKLAAYQLEDMFWNLESLDRYLGYLREISAGARHLTDPAADLVQKVRRTLLSVALTDIAGEALPQRTAGAAPDDGCSSPPEYQSTPHAAGGVAAPAPRATRDDA